MNGFGQKIRELRERNNLLLRQVASSIAIDQALLSKIERGDRIATRNQVLALAKFFNVKEPEILALWLGQKIAYEIKDEAFANDALKIAEETIWYLTHLKVS
jgi:HTH-type transcriptional regulator, competence development regulator